MRRSLAHDSDASHGEFVRFRVCALAAALRNAHGVVQTFRCSFVLEEEAPWATREPIAKNKRARRQDDPAPRRAPRLQRTNRD